MPRSRIKQEPRTTLKLDARTLAKAAGGVLACAWMMFTVAGVHKGGGNLQGYDWRMTLEVAGRAAGAAWTDFPLLVQLTHEDLRARNAGGRVASPEGLDLRFTRADGATLLLHRIESYDPVQGSLRAWVSLDTLYAGRPGRICLYFGNAEERQPLRLETPAHRFRSALAGDPLPAGVSAAAWAEAEHQARSAPEQWVRILGVESVHGPYSARYAYVKAGIRAGSLVIVEWATAREEDNDYFIVERSRDGKQFEVLGQMGGDSYSDATLTYSMPDARPYPGRTFYRIRQIDNDGDFSFSDLVYADYQAALQPLEVWLDADQLGAAPLGVHLRADTPDELRIELYDADGRLLANQAAAFGPGQHQHAFPVPAGLPPGLYVLSVMGRDRVAKTFRLEKP